MTKQDKIKEAYGEYYDKVKNNIDDSGWCTMINKDNVFVSPTCLDLGMTREYYDNNIEGGYFSDSNTHKWRPKSLIGIENNNGWVKIESEDDNPKYDGNYFVIDNDSYKSISIQCYYGNGSWDCHLNITHYHPIALPKPPIY
ncbi:hypothetical protein [Paenimyroides baculatum]|uniref:DUF551 domain-containing protein n=1 Tax=Paenimyroides baculatum TaxID=2608000 RepID=A0A5M6CFT5_9FLAO|nr:hypothetical protein [Paenimyroides baculatum]KAA5532782.1 hypothetical protein F0460_13130 [Paenimyroides baculatum]